MADRLLLRTISRSVILACDVVLSHARLQSRSLQPQTSRRTIGPPTCPFASSSAFTIRSLSTAQSCSNFGHAVRPEQSFDMSSGMATLSVFPVVRMTDRSSTFCSSRMLPGQS